MAIFNKTKKAAISPAPSKTAAVGGGFSPGYSSSNVGVNMIGQYYTYREGEARNAAISVPTINRARDLMASVIGSMNLRSYNEFWNGEEMEKIYIAPRSWLRRPDPTVSFQFLMSWTLDDLMMFGRAFWYITSRTADGYPATFTRLPAGSITTTDMKQRVTATHRQAFLPAYLSKLVANHLARKNLLIWLARLMPLAQLTRLQL
jgi:hypothetical protein